MMQWVQVDWQVGLSCRDLWRFIEQGSHQVLLIYEPR